MIGPVLIGMLMLSGLIVAGKIVDMKKDRLTELGSFVLIVALFVFFITLIAYINHLTNG